MWVAWSVLTQLSAPTKNRLEEAGSLLEEGAGKGARIFRPPAARRVAAQNHYLMMSIILNR